MMRAIGSFLNFLIARNARLRVAWHVTLAMLLPLFPCASQSPDQRSEYGKSLPASGTIRVLVLFAEIEYDLHPETDPLYGVHPAAGWSKGTLPDWKDDLFDPFTVKEPQARLTRYFHENSFGRYRVIGDYVDRLFTIKESMLKGRPNTAAMTHSLLAMVCNSGELTSHSGLRYADFDLWTITGYGTPKVTPSIDNPSRIDHVMVIYRNINTINNQSGFASPGSIGSLCGWQSDTWSAFRSSDVLPFNIAKHEYVHLLLGDNNFHAGGGNGSRPTYHLCYQGGWSLLGGANSSLLTCNGWDRDRLQWIHPDKQYSISARDTGNEEVYADLDPATAPPQQILLLGDFMTTGDAIRIRIPLADSASAPQWLWIENHATSGNNNTLSDSYQYGEAQCTELPAAGLYMFIQTGKHIRSGPALYGGLADYVKPLPADGNYDLVWNTDTVPNECVNSVGYIPFERNPRYSNPFTGNHGLEFALADRDKNGTIHDNEKMALAIEKTGGALRKNLGFLGDASDAFQTGGNRRIGIDTNPSTAPAITHSADPIQGAGYLHAGQSGNADNTIILLNGISVELLEYLPGNTARVRVRFDDTVIRRSVRWCADTIMAPAGMILLVEKGGSILLDRGRTPTRTVNPIEWEGESLYTNPTTMVIDSGATVYVSEGAELKVMNGSTLTVAAGGTLHLEAKAKLTLKNRSVLDLQKGGSLIRSRKASVSTDKKSRVNVSESLPMKN